MKKEVKTILDFCEALKTQARESLIALTEGAKKGRIPQEKATELKNYTWGELASLNNVIGFIKALYEEEK